MQRKTRILLPWFERHEAIGALLGFRIPSPGEDVSDAETLYERQRAALLARPPYREEPVEVGPLPPESRAAGDRALATYEAASPESVRGPTRTAVVDLSNVLAFQKFVWLDETGGRAAAVSDWDSLVEACLPDHDPEGGRVEGTFDADGKGLTMSSLNPNLRAGPLQNVKMAVASGDRVIGFPVMFGLPFVHVAEYRGRYFLKDGYHRAHALLGRGITRVPCLLESARTFADVHAGRASLVAPEALLGPHPPRLTDFFDASVSCEVERQAFRKVLRIRAEEFVVNL